MQLAIIDAGGLIAGTAAVAGEVVEFNESATVACTGASVEIFAANNSRRGLIIQNKHGLNTINIKFGSAATANSLELGPKERFVMDMHNRDIRSFNVLGPNGTPFVAVQIVKP